MKIGKKIMKQQEKQRPFNVWPITFSQRIMPIAFAIVTDSTLFMIAHGFITTSVPLKRDDY